MIKGIVYFCKIVDGFSNPRANGMERDGLIGGLQISNLIIKIRTLQNQWLERINGSNPMSDDGPDEHQIGLIIVIYRDND